ncbi:hypothetical protein [Terrabacter sp. NPDC080008]|uniref:DUF6912 family protein n=1 Tax=Terrabacter sp. NPDC080008 TaxID=3155176 RepID=UPI00344FE20A
MPVVRVYVPLGRAGLEELAGTGALAAGPGSPRIAYAVTSRLERLAPGLDLEDLEYAAFSDAVTAAAELRAAPSDRRVVASADADASWVAPREDAPVSKVLLTQPVPLARVASFHIDEEGPAGFDEEADELLWYDVTELDDVRSFFG